MGCRKQPVSVDIAPKNETTANGPYSYGGMQRPVNKRQSHQTVHTNSHVETSPLPSSSMSVTHDYMDGDTISNDQCNFSGVSNGQSRKRLWKPRAAFKPIYRQTQQWLIAVAATGGYGCTEVYATNDDDWVEAAINKCWSQARAKRERNTAQSLIDPMPEREGIQFVRKFPNAVRYTTNTPPVTRSAQNVTKHYQFASPSEHACKGPGDPVGRRGPEGMGRGPVKEQHIRML